MRKKMNSLLEKLQYKIYIYSQKYNDRYYLIIFKLIFFLIRSLFTKKKNDPTPTIPYLKKKKNENCLVIGCVLGGGIGDILLGYLYIVKLSQKLDCKHKLHLFVGQSIDSVQSLLNNNQIISSISRMDSLPHNKDLDLLIRLEVQFPNLSFINHNKISRLSRFLIDYKNELKKFEENYLNIVGSGDRTFYQQAFCLIRNKTRITAMDVHEILGLKNTDRLNLSIPDDGNNILQKYNLSKKKYITINRSCDINNKNSESLKLWPVQNFNELTSFLKSKYPEIPIIQLGYSAERCKTISNTDINLIGKTNFAEVMALLHNSFLHIDGEGGLVHLRHFLCAKPSVVLFGPTSPKNRGYPENINIRNTDCPCQFCEWIVGENWQSYCIKSGSAIPLCMCSISPSLVIKKIEESEIISSQI